MCGVVQADSLQSVVAVNFAKSMVDAPNYLEQTFEIHGVEGIGDVTVTVVRKNGKTPHQFRIEAEQERDKYKSVLEEIMSIPCYIWEKDYWIKEVKRKTAEVLGVEDYEITTDD